MHTENSIVVDAPAARIYELGARIADWPTILPHYRWVHILRDEGAWRHIARQPNGFNCVAFAVDPLARRG